MNKDMFLCLRSVHETGNTDTLSSDQYDTLVDHGWINPNDKRLTKLAYESLAPYKVESALILAAGFGSRFVPYTYEKPKGLLEVNGKVMLERQIEQLKAKGIDNIIVTVGYLKKQFEYLKNHYNVTIIDNQDYEIKNNISSIYYAPSVMITGNVYILTSDVIYKDNPFHEYEYQSWYSLKYFSEYTPEWFAQFDENDLIQDVSIGGSTGYAMYGPAFFDRDFSKKLYNAVVRIYKDENKSNYYWENVYLDNRDELDLYANLEELGVIEFECFEELVAYDPSYDTNIRNTIMKTITQKLNCTPSQLKNIIPIENENNFLRFNFNFNTKHYVASIDQNDFSQVEVYENE